MEKIVYRSKPIGKEKIVLELTTLKEEKKEIKKRIERNKSTNRKDSDYEIRMILTNLEERNNFVNMNDPYWQWYFKHD